MKLPIVPEFGGLQDGPVHRAKLLGTSRKMAMLPLEAIVSTGLDTAPYPRRRKKSKTASSEPAPRISILG